MPQAQNIDGVQNKEQTPNPPRTPNYSPEEEGKILRSWESSEYEQQSKPRSWYIVAAVIGLILIGISIYMRNYLFLVVVVMMAVVIILMDRKAPISLETKITDKGIRYGKRFYPYTNLEHFWIIYDPPIKTLNFRTTRNLFPMISIQLEDQNPLEIRDILLNFLPENEEITEESPSARITRFLKI